MRAVHKSNGMSYIKHLYKSYNFRYNKMEHKIHPDQKASQADICQNKQRKHKPRSIIFKTMQNANPKHVGKAPKTHRQSRLGLNAFLFITYIYIERVSLDTQWMILEIKVLHDWYPRFLSKLYIAYFSIKREIKFICRLSSSLDVNNIYLFQGVMTYQDKSAVAL